MATTMTRRTRRKSRQSHRPDRRRAIEHYMKRRMFLEKLEDRRLLDGTSTWTGTDEFECGDPGCPLCAGLRQETEDWDTSDLRHRLGMDAPVYGPQVAPLQTSMLGTSSQWTSAQDTPFFLRRELVIIDRSVSDYKQLLTDLARANDRWAQIEALMIDTDVDGVAALTQILDRVQDVDAIHIVSHGRDGMVRLGNVSLTADNLDQYADQIAGWRSALKPTSDILFYGCNLASSDAGRAFVDQLQELVGVDVAASNDTTGDYDRGGNWDLEYQTGPIEAQNPFSDQLQQSYTAALAMRTFAAGSYVIDMGQAQTVGNALKPYGLLYDLVTNQRIPVSWAIAPNKDWAFTSDPLGNDTIGNTVDFTAMADHDWDPNTASISKDYRGGSFIIQASLMTPSILSTINSWRTQGVVVDPITEQFDAFIYDDVTSFPKAVLDQNNGKIVFGYYANAGIPSTSYRIALPTQLNPCDDVFVIPHADPHTWAPEQRVALDNFIRNQRGGMWAACHSPSSFESFGGLITDVNMNYLSSTGLIPWTAHASGTPPYQYNESPNAADDPLMQIMNRFDLAMTNGSEQIFIPQTTWRPETTVAVYQPSGHPQRPAPADAYAAPAAVVYGNAFGNPDAGLIMYQAGHTHTKGPILDQIAAQRAYFNFIVYNGVLRAPKIDVDIPPIVAGETVTLSATITGGSGSGTYQWISYNGSTFSQRTGTWIAGEEISTEFLLTVPDDTVKLLITDSCGRRSVWGEGVSDTPPVLGPDYFGCFEAGGVAVPAVSSVDIDDLGTVITGSVIRLTNRPDGAAETLTINQTLAASYGISVTSDGAGGFNLVGNATQAQYEAVLNTLQYINTLASPTLTDRIITITVNDGASDSNTLTSTLHPPTDGDFTNVGGTPVSTYYEGDTIYFTVNDQTGNLDSGTVDTITITVTSTSGDSEQVELTETGPNTGIFTGSIASTTDAAEIDNGEITAIIGNTLTATHASVDGCGVWTDTVQIIEPIFERKELYFTP